MFSDTFDRRVDSHNMDADVGDADAVDAGTVDAYTVDADTVDADVVDAYTVDADVVDADVVDADGDAVDRDAVDGDAVDRDVPARDIAEADLIGVDLSDGPVGTGGDMVPGAVPVNDYVGVPDRSELTARWQQAQLSFIDDPAGSADAAAAIATEALEAHIAALRGRLADLDAWQSGGQASGVHDTEVLRTAVHGYRTFVEQVVGE